MQEKERITRKYKKKNKKQRKKKRKEKVSQCEISLISYSFGFRFSILAFRFSVLPIFEFGFSIFDFLFFWSFLSLYFILLFYFILVFYFLFCTPCFFFSLTYWAVSSVKSIIADAQSNSTTISLKTTRRFVAVYKPKINKNTWNRIK